MDYTIKGALNRGYQVYVIRDAILALFGKESLEKMLQKYEDSGGKVITLDEFLRVEE
ncbi:MAG: isochorismatase family protein [Firmicutes bacterium]|nr:isochorismatase family protein [Bacillota bacterium]